MGAYKNKKNNTWYVQNRYKDWKGEQKQVFHRGFATKREALAWEKEFMLTVKTDLSMTMETYAKLYEEDVKPGLKLNTWLMKENIIRTKILPYLGNRKVSEITAGDILTWQNEIRKQTNPKNGEPYASGYLKTIHNQLSAMFNHAMKYYGLKSNPAQLAGNMGKESNKEMLFWTKDEYLKFSEVMMDKEISFYAFEVLYWTGIREGELLALTASDFDFKAKKMFITKSYQRLRGEDIITTPKTENSKRAVDLPDFLNDEMQDYLKLFYKTDPEARIFPVTKRYLQHEMQRGCKESGVKKIRIHDLRHSHVSMLIDMGETALAIGKRIGHKAQDITYHYAHLYPNAQAEMAQRIDKERGEAYVSEDTGSTRKMEK